MSATSPSPPSSRPKRKANLGGSTVLGGMKLLQSRSRKSHDPQSVRPASLLRSHATPPRLARAHRAALARPSAAQAPSRVPSARVPSGRCIARDMPPRGARHKPETAARVDRARRPTSLYRATPRRATHALAAFVRWAAPPLHAPHAFASRAFGEKAACSRSRLAASYTSTPHLGILRDA